jgi:hypothetical protein
MAEQGVVVIPQGGIRIEVNGSERLLRYSINRLLEIEDRLGVDMLNNGMALFSAQHLGNLKTLRFLLWTGIGGKAEGIGEEEVGDWFDPQNMPILSKAVAAALMSSFDEIKPIEATEGTDAGEEKKE